MGANGSTNGASNTTPASNLTCGCPGPHRGEVVQETQNCLNTEPEFDYRQVRRDLTELTRFFKAPTGKYLNEVSSIEQQILSKLMFSKK